MATTATPAAGLTATTANRGRFVWHELMTTDTAAAEAFYKKVVGWGTKKSDMPGIEYTTWLAGETPIGGLTPLLAEAAAMGAPPSWMAYVEVPDADATVALATQLGATVLMPAFSVDGVGRFAILRDPQGAVIAVITSAMAMAPETDPAPQQFSWHELATSDQAAGISFYEQLFGWTKKSEFDMGEMGIYHMFGRDRFTYGGIMRKPENVPSSYWMHYIQVDSADAAAERAQQGGATLAMGPMEVPGGDRVAMLTDPQGAWFAVHSKASA
jgi:predicted enzyme related to lactoylglutathione lyase